MTSLRKRTREEYIHAKIYKWQFTPPFPHVLENCCYFGQTRQDFDVRIRQHKLNSICDTKELGLHALWRQYPYDSYWKISLLEEKFFDDVVSAGEWMNQREIALIEENGGILRDMDAKLKQTLNLTSGGQGDPQKIYQCIIAISRRKLNKIRPAFDKFYAREKHLRIPKHHTEEVNGKKIKLGRIVNSIRALGCFLQHLDFKQWLDCHDFVYDERRAHLEMEVWHAFKQFYEREKHLRISINHTEEVNGKKINLGQIVSHIRALGCFLQHLDFKQWLDSHDFVYDKRRAHLEMEVKPAFKQFYARENHLRIPTNHTENVNGEKVKLGNIVNQIRSRGIFLQYENFKQWLDTHNFVYDEYRAHLEEEVWPAFKQFYERENHLRVPQNHTEEVNGKKINLGRIVNKIRSKGIFLQYKDFAMWLWCGCFKMHTQNGDENTSRWNRIFNTNIKV